MQTLLYVMIEFFILDIVVGVIDGIIEGKRVVKFDKRLWWIEQQLDKDISDNVFPEFKGGNDYENDIG